MLLNINQFSRKLELGWHPFFGIAVQERGLYYLLNTYYVSGTVIVILVQLSVRVLCPVRIIITCCSFLSTFLTYVYSFKCVYTYIQLCTRGSDPLVFSPCSAVMSQGLLVCCCPMPTMSSWCCYCHLFPPRRSFFLTSAYSHLNLLLKFSSLLLLWHPSFLTLPLLLCSFLLILLLCPPRSPLLSRCSSAGSALCLLAPWLASTRRPPPHEESCPLSVLSLLWAPC